MDMDLLTTVAVLVLWSIQIPLEFQRFKWLLLIHMPKSQHIDLVCQTDVNMDADHLVQGLKVAAYVVQPLFGYND